MRFRLLFAIMGLLGFCGLQAQNPSDTLDNLSGAVFQLNGKTHFPGLLNLLDRTYTFIGNGKDTLVYLPDKRLIVESEEIRMGRILFVRHRDYAINYPNGEIFFHVPPEEGEQIIIRYRVMPFDLSNRYRRRDLKLVELIYDTSGSVTTTLFRKITSDETPFLGSSRLTGSGSIMRGFTIGSNQDFTLNSGLNIQIAGQLTDDVTIEASLTDESTPIQPEGNTETLQEIDKVFIEIRKADRYSATFGDFDFQLQGTEFGNFSRKLQGVKAAGNTERWQLDLTYASSTGRYATNTLNIQEGVQGPYALTGSGGERNILIIAGTEKVWLNGVLLRRGEDQDYVMDYSAAHIFFTRRRLITPESRVVVDFEYTEDIFRRITMAGKIQTHWADQRLRFGVLWIYDYDDKNNPVNLTLSREVRDSLAGINDRSVGAGGPVIYVSGAVWVGNGRGAYQKTFNSATGDSIFMYTGTDSAGQYNVRFSYVGDGKGDYIRGLVLGEFRYVGKNAGDYLPVVPLTLPVKHALGSVFLQTNPFKGWSLYAEMAVSGFDVNAFSPQQFVGRAGILTLRAEKQPLKVAGHDWGEMDLLARFRSKDSLFTEAGRLNPSEFNREWNVQRDQSGRALNREIIQEAQMEYRPVSYLRIVPNYGLMKRGVQDFSSERVGLAFGFQPEKWPSLQYRYDRISTEQQTGGQSIYSNVRRHIASARYTIWKLTPGVDFENEILRNRHQDSVTGTNYMLYRASMDAQGFSITQFGSSWEQRLDWLRNNRRDSLNGLVSVASTLKAYWNILNWKELNTRTELSFREKKYCGNFRSTVNPDNRTLLIHSTVDYSALRRVVQMSMNYQVSEEQIQNRKIIFIPVGANQGNFVRVARDSFVQVPQGQGDWIQGSVRANRFTAVVDLSAGMRLRVEPYRWTMNSDYSTYPSFYSDSTEKSVRTLWGWLVQETAWETFLRVEENQKHPDWSFYFLNFNQYLQQGQTVRGTLLFRQDLIFFPRQTGRSVRLRYERQDNLTDLLVDGRDRRSKEMKNLRWREQWNPRWASETEIETEQQTRRSSISYGSVQPDFTIKRNKLMPVFFYRPRPHIEISLRSQWIMGKEAILSRRATLITVMPEWSYAFQTKGRVTANLEMVHTRIQPTRAAVPYELTDGNLEGTTYRWMLYATYRIGDHLSSGLNYTGRKEPRQPVIHIASAEIRAFF